MKPGFSLWLDVLRAGAALVVLFGHMAHIRFTRGDYYFLREINIASDAVILFFVLSGVVIAYAAGRDGSLGRFAFNRLTRVWSVVLPALVLTVIFDAWGVATNPAAYPADYYQPKPLGEMFLRGLSFTNEWQGAFSDRLRLGTNGPLWSLSYEVGFYALFAAVLFLKGALRWVMAALIALLVGLPILALLPAWALGVWVWYRVSPRRERDDQPGGQSGPRPILGTRQSAAWMLAVAPLICLVALKAIGLDTALSAMTARFFAPMSHHLVLGYSDEVLWNSLMAVLIAAHLIGVWQLCAARTAGTEGRMARAVRWVAGGSFSLYVMHYPTLHLLDATLPESLPGYDFWLLGLTLAICFGFAALFERPLKFYRRAAINLWNSAPLKVARSAG